MTAIAPQPASAATAPAVTWRLRFAIIFTGFCAMLNLYAPQAILPTLAREFSVSPSRIGLVITATTLAVALCGPFSSAVADRFGRKTVIVGALAFLAIPTLASGFSVTLNQMILTRFLQGVFIPAAFAAALGLMAEVFKKGGIAAMMSLYVAANVSGGFAGRLIGGVAAQFLDWHVSFFILAAVNTMGALAVALLIPQGIGGSATDKSVSPTAIVRGILANLRNVDLMASYFVGFNVLFGLVAVFNFVNFYLGAAPFHLTQYQLGLVFCVYLVGIFITPLAGKWIDRFGQQRALITASVTGIIGLLLTLVPHLASVVIGLAVFCSASFVCQSSATSRLSIVAGKNRSSAAGLYLTFYYGGGAFGAFVPGYAWSTGGWPLCIALVIALQFLIAMTAWYAFKVTGHISRHGATP